MFGISSAQAVDVDTGTPDILSSVSSGLVQTLSKAESAEVRGEYWTCENFSFPRGKRCYPQFSRWRQASFEDRGYYTVTRTYLGQSGIYFVSR